MSRIISLAAFLSFSIAAMAAVSEDNLRLRKLSFHLRGIPPSREEYAALETRVRAGAREAFFTQKIGEYQRSPYYLAKMVERFHELFRFKNEAEALEELFNPHPQSNRSKEEYFDGKENLSNSADLLFLDMVKEDLTWDTILKSKRYLIAKSTTGSGYFDIDNRAYQFLSLLLPEKTDPRAPKDPPKPAEKKPPTAKPDAQKPPLETDANGEPRKPAPSTEPFPIKSKLVNFSFDKDDPRVAGALSTEKFNGRYATNSTNKNRRRAAAVFRIFLCDEMQATVQITSGATEDPQLENAFPKDVETEAANDTAKKAPEDKRHGSDASCVHCHEKLDPMGKTFQAMSALLSPEPTSGALVFTNKKGKKVNIPVKGLGDLAQKISEQPEYLDCQVKHFWDWFIGDDIPLSEGRREQLVRKFNGFGRRPREFIAYLVSEPDFYKAPEARRGVVAPQNEEPPKFSAVKNTLENCTKCHQQKKEDIPDFTKLPIDNAESHAYWIRQISQQLDFTHNGENRKMPPKEADWQLSDKDYRALKAWIAGRAQDDDGKSTIGDDTATRITSARSLDVLHPEFNHGFIRYLSGRDIQRTLKLILPDERIYDQNRKGYGFVSQNCSFRDRFEEGTSITVLGSPSAMTGEPIQKEPNSSFLRAYISCLQNTIQNDFKIYDRIIEADPEHFQDTPEELQKRTGEDLRKYVGEVAAAHLDRNAKNSVFNLRWDTISEETRRQIALHLIRELIGPHIISDETAFAAELELSAHTRLGVFETHGDESDNKRQKAPSPYLREAIEKMVITIALSDDYLVY